MHEMAQILEKKYTNCFRELMDSILLSWRTLWEDLTGTPLVHEEWKY
jgi:hypothetical protein